MSLQLPDLRQLKSFVALADTGSFTLAAQNLYVTQSAVSHSIKALEDLLNTRLVERLGKRVNLTREGGVFLIRCRKILGELETAAREIDGLRRWGQGRIRIGATHSLCQYLLPNVLREFKDCFTRCEILIESNDTSELLNLLDRAEIDVALGLEAMRPAWCEFVPLFTDRLVAIVPPFHTWASYKEVPNEEWEHQQLISYGRASETNRLVMEHFKRQNVKLGATLTLGDMEAIKAMVKIGVGVGLVAPWTARKEIDSGELVAVSIGSWPIQRTWGVFLNSNKKPSMVEETFVGICELVGKEFA